MLARLHPKPLSVEDYLESELRSEVKHEFLGGDAVVPLPELGIELPLDELYEGLGV